MDAWRVAVLGDGGVGKTALAVQFTLNKFIEWYDPTIEDTYRTKLLVDDRMCFVEVIDTAGQEEYSILRDQWAREGQAFVLVYSILQRTSFNRLTTFKDAMLRAKRFNPIFVLVGNMTDREDARQVTYQEGRALAREFGCEYMETSAKTAENVQEVFVGIIRRLRAGEGPLSPTGSGGGGLPAGTGKRKKKKGGGCIIA